MTSFLILDHPISTQSMLIGSLLWFKLAHKIADFLSSWLLVITVSSCDCSKELLNAILHCILPTASIASTSHKLWCYTLHQTVDTNHSCCQISRTVNSCTYSQNAPCVVDFWLALPSAFANQLITAIRLADLQLSRRMDLLLQYVLALSLLTFCMNFQIAICTSLLLTDLELLLLSLSTVSCTSCNFWILIVFLSFYLDLVLICCSNVNAKIGPLLL